MQSKYQLIKLSEINYDADTSAVKSWTHMDTNIGLFVHNIDNDVLTKNLENISPFLATFKTGTEVLDAMGEILCFLLSKLANG